MLPVLHAPTARGLDEGVWKAIYACNESYMSSKKGERLWKDRYDMLEAFNKTVTAAS